MRKTILLIIMLVTCFVAKPQQFFFFCINLGDNTDGNYVAEVIDGALKQLGRQDEFLIYIRGGVNQEGKVFDAVQITDQTEWGKAKGLLDYIDRCSVLATSEVDMLKHIFQSHYVVNGQKLRPIKPTTVFWFGNERYYLNFGRTLFLPIYFAMDGESTWRNCYLYGDTRQMKTVSLEERLCVSEYSINNVIVK